QKKVHLRVGQFFDTLHSAHKLAEIDEMKPSARDRLIIALDVGTRAEGTSLALTLAPFAGWMKIGLQLFAAEGPDLVRAIRETGASVFLDLKLHDIPNTVARAVQSVAKLDVQMLTLHLSGGAEMVRAAVAAAPENLLVLGVTARTFLQLGDRSLPRPIRSLPPEKFSKKSKAVVSELIVIDDPTPRAGPLNMAIDEVLLTTARPAILRFYRWNAPWVSFGYFVRF